MNIKLAYNSRQHFESRCVEMRDIQQSNLQHLPRFLHARDGPGTDWRRRKKRLALPVRAGKMMGRHQTFLDIWKNTDSDLTSVEVPKARLVALKHGS